MATYAEAAQAKELIQRVASLNNAIVRNLSDSMALRAKLTALTSEQQTVVRAAVQDMGYDDTEIVAILNRIAQVDTEANRVGLVAVPQP